MISAKFLTSHKQHQHYINSRLSKYDIVAGLVEHYRYGRLPQFVNISLFCYNLGNTVVLYHLIKIIFGYTTDEILCLRKKHPSRGCLLFHVT